MHGYYDFVLFAVPVLGILPALTIFPLLTWGFKHLKKNISTAISEDIAAGRTSAGSEKNLTGQCGKKSQSFGG